ncbi:MAG: hypothetical protein ABI379_05000 [Rhodanobacter sp.]
MQATDDQHAAGCNDTSCLLQHFGEVDYNLQRMAQPNQIEGIVNEGQWFICCANQIAAIARAIDQQLRPLSEQWQRGWKFSPAGRDQ